MTPRVLADLDALDDLPSPSPIVVRLLAIVGRDDVGLADVEDIVARDPVIAARIVAAANAAAWASHGRTTTIRAALLRLGLERVRRLALVVSLYNTTARRPPAPSFWRHSLAVAHGAEAFARLSATDEAPETAFLAGLVHDIGRLVLTTHYADHEREIQALARAEAIGLVAAERRVIGVDHGEVGAGLAAHWSFPPAVVDAVRRHHAPDALTPERSVVTLVAAADALAGREAVWSLGDGILEDDRDVAAALGLDPGDFAVLMEDAFLEAARAATALVHGTG